jgi:hypothetical protein
MGVARMDTPHHFNDVWLGVPGEVTSGLPPGTA